MLTDLVTLGPDTPVLEGINNLLQAHIKGAPVVDAKHNYLGIFTELCSLKVLMALCGGQSLSEYSRSDSNTSGGIMTKQLWMLQPEMDGFQDVCQELLWSIMKDVTWALSARSTAWMS